MNSPTLDRAFVRSQRMIGRRIGGALVLVPQAARGAEVDSVLSLNRVAAFVWEQLDGERTGERVVDAVVARFDVERERAAADYLELLGTLLDLGAVAPSPGRAR